jgi:transcriptional regulator with XRE-family HTH domain
MINEKNIEQARKLFGLAFKDLRLEKGLSLGQVGEFCGVTYQTISKIEQGQFPYSVDLLLKLSIILEFTINFEIKEKADKNRFILQEGKKTDWFIVTDTSNQIVCSFKAGAFNESQEFTFLNDKPIANVATIMREFGDWLAENNPNII